MGGRVHSGSGAGRGGSQATACQSERVPEPELVSPVELDPDVVARAGAVLGSCWPDDGVDRNAGYLWDAQTGRPIPIGYGVMSADELQDRIYLLTSKEAGRDY